jgi:hypothetical protein
MKIVTSIEEESILEELREDISRVAPEDEEAMHELNSIAIAKIYKSEACDRCGYVVSELSENRLCGYCEA